MTYRETKAAIKARRTRKAIAKVYKHDPRRALAHVNAKLDRASRLEEYRAQKLAAFE